MPSASNQLILTDANLIGAGAHKITYAYPEKKNLCVKVTKSTHDIDLERELAYRKAREKHHKLSKLMPLYLGTIMTNKGEAHVFERICDYDDKTSLTLDEHIKHIIKVNTHDDAQKHLKSLLLSFKKLWFEEKIVTSNIELVNFMVQRKTPDEACIRIVDNIGTPVMIPLAYHFDYFATKRAIKYWKRFVDVLKTTFPNQLSHELLIELEK